MHILYYIIFKKSYVRNRSDAIKFVEKFLLDKMDDVRFFSNDDYLGDWFAIGGRWSGELSIIKLGNKYTKSLENIGFKSDNIIHNVENDQKLRMEWASLGQDGTHPLLRDSYLSDGPYADDAAIIDQSIYNAIKDGKNYIDIDNETLSEDFINNKWVVIADIHQ
jgi:hypothetical protein